MRIFFKNGHDLMCDMEDGKPIFFKNGHYLMLMCDMEDGKPIFQLGWVRHNPVASKFYCLCSWMTDIPTDSYKREWLQKSTYPEGHIFDTGHEATQALVDSAIVAVIGGFRGRGERT